ncbi:CAP domain-containing protein [Mycolicibacterium sp. CBMA 226]|uniref:CAP domain-containing protein n=1 Tax=Mycolicibacterium sp. CBMA 226 TaxID=2606611 RepID=UPI0012DF94FF|nr:CAP domain-containing protein [Mycolicibacterium sp. CBMA 226]
MRCRPLVLSVLAAVPVSAVLCTPLTHADNGNTLIPNNKRLNDSVVSNVYTVQHQAGCTNDIAVNPQLQQAAARQARDMIANRDLDGDIGSDGSTPQLRAEQAGYRGGPVAQTVAINPAIAISGVDLINRWYYDPVIKQIMANCANNQMGVWSENSLDRTVVVAVYGQLPEPPHRDDKEGGTNNGFDPSPDYDGSDELEHGLDWFPWILRGVHPPPAYPPN